MPCLSIGYTPGVLMQPTVRRFVTWASDQAACSMTRAQERKLRHTDEHRLPSAQRTSGRRKTCLFLMIWCSEISRISLA